MNKRIKIETLITITDEDGKGIAFKERWVYEMWAGLVNTLHEGNDNDYSANKIARIHFLRNATEQLDVERVGGTEYDNPDCSLPIPLANLLIKEGIETESS